MNEPSEPWVWGTSPPVVITAQVPTRGCPARAVGVASWARDVCPTANALARAPVTADARTERRRNAHLPEVPSGHYHGAARAHHRTDGSWRRATGARCGPQERRKSPVVAEDTASCAVCGASWAGVVGETMCQERITNISR